MDQEIVAKGQHCFAAVQRAYNLIYTEGQGKEAEKILVALREDGKQLQKAAKETKENFIAEGKKLRDEIAQLEAEEQKFQCEVSSLTSQKSTAEYHLQNQERALSEARQQLSEAESKLRRAESDLRSAKEKEKNVAVASVTGGVLLGLVTFGVGGLAVGALAGGATAAIINNIEGRCRDARHEKRRCSSDVESSERNLSSTRERVNSYERDIRDYNSRIQRNRRAAEEAHNKVSIMMKSRDFCETSDDFWTEFIAVSKAATERSDRLKKLVDRAIKRENMKVLRANGTTVIVESFVEAWEEVSKRGQIMPA